jgi:hypothetical protein
MLKRIKLYKYLPFSDGSLKILSEGTIKFSKPSEFNDPFDCAPDHKSDNIEEFLESRSDLVDRVFQLKMLHQKILIAKKELWWRD